MHDHSHISNRYGEYFVERGPGGLPVVLGEGQFGKTVPCYRERRLGDSAIRDEFALKILHDSLLDRPDRKDRLFQEILAMRALQHPNLVRYIDCGEQGGSVFLVMELCRGGDLTALCGRLGGLPERAVLRIALQICEGLDEAHRSGFVHRDLKPSNILIWQDLPTDLSRDSLQQGLDSGSLRFKVVDFGLVGRLDAAAGGREGFLGTPMFASPEHFSKAALDARSDIYSLGMTIWYLLLGFGPLMRGAGDKPIRSLEEAGRRHTSPSPHDPEFPGELSAGARSILSTMLAKNRDDRFSSASEAASAIRAVLGESTGEAFGSSGIRRGSDAPGSTGGVPGLSDAEFGEGDEQSFYKFEHRSGNRSIGKCYKAHMKRCGTPVALTLWEAPQPEPGEVDFALKSYLEKLYWTISDEALAPAEILRIREVRRTKSYWCVAEDWSDGVSLERFLAGRDRSLSVEDASDILVPLANACDHLYQNGYTKAPLHVEEVRLDLESGTKRVEDFLERPLAEWPPWTIRFSALSIPDELYEGSGGDEDLLARTISSSMGWGSGSSDLFKSFCRLLYRLVEGSELPIAADWDRTAYVEASKLSASSNILIREGVAADPGGHSAVELLRSICAKEGIYRSFDLGPSASVSNPSRSLSASQSRESPPRSTVPIPVASESLGSFLRPGLAEAGASNAATSTNRSSAVAPSSSTSVSSEALDVCEVVAPGRVRSPHSGEELSVSGESWYGGARIQCPTTGRWFRLPDRPLALEAIAILGEIERVLTPYTNPPSAVSVPSEKWRRGGEFVCPQTGRPLTLPHDLPIPLAEVLDDRPGRVRFPEFGGREIVVPPAHWEDGCVFFSAELSREVELPMGLPPLLAERLEPPGCFRSPFPPNEEFELPAGQCVPHDRVSCPATGRPLLIPETVNDWVFEGYVRVEPHPQAASPYIEDGKRVWQALEHHQWHSGGQIKCLRTGRSFCLPAKLPVVPVQNIVAPCRVRLPFPSALDVKIPADEWLPGREFPIKTVSGLEMEIRLPDAVADPAHAPLAKSFDPDTLEVCGPFRASKPFQIEAERWNKGELLFCETAKREFRLPSNLPLPVGKLVGEEFGKIQSPFGGPAAPVIEVPASKWTEGEEIFDPAAGRSFALPSALPEWVVDGFLIPCYPGWVRSPYGTSPEFPVESADWRAASMVKCPETGRSFRLPLPADAPGLALERAVVDASLDQPKESEFSVVNALRDEYPQISADAVREIWTRHGIDSQKKRRNALPRGEVVEAACLKRGVVLSPFVADETLEVSPFDWRPGKRLKCPKTRRAFRLPDPLPPLLGVVREAGAAVSPYVELAVPQLVDPPELWWQERATMKCRETSMEFLLPREKPAWHPEGNLSAGELLKVRSPYGKRGLQEVPPSLWGDGVELNCAETGYPFVLPAGVPPLEALLDGDCSGVVLSPYAEGVRVPVALDDWEGGNTVLCPETGRRMVLPKQLPEWVPDGLEPTATGNQGRIRSPYGERALVEVAGPDWESGKTLACQTSGKLFRLPHPLPPLVAKLLEGAGSGRPEALGRVLSPYASEEVVIEVPASAWEKGGEVFCPRTGRPCLLPSDLPEWILDGEAIEGRPGFVRSPYREGVEVEVAARDWETGRHVECPASGRRLRLPASLPPLPGRVDAQKPGWVESPYDPESRFQVAYDQWRSGERLTCSRTGRVFCLPDFLPEWLLEAEPVEGRPGRVRSPHGSRPEFDVPGHLWKAGGELSCPETARKLRLPAMLPPLLANPVPGSPGRAVTPYTDPPREVALPRRQWRSGGIADCPETGRPLRLPEGLEPLPARRAPWLLAPLALAAVAALAGWWFWSQRGAEAGREGEAGLAQTDGTGGKGRETSGAASTEEALGMTGSAELDEAPPPPPKPWPEKLQIRSWLVASPDWRAALILEAAGKPFPELPRKGKERGEGMDFDLSGIDFGSADSAWLQLEAPGFEPRRVSLNRKTEGWAQEEGVQVEKGDFDLVRLEGRVSLSGDLKHPCYGSVRFTMVEAPAGAGTARPVEHPLDGGGLELETGTYRVELVGRKGLATSQGTVQVDDRVLRDRLEVASDPSKAEDVAIPAWPLPRLAAGLERVDRGTVATTMFGVEPTNPDFGKVSRPWTMPVERAVLLEFANSPLEGTFYGEAYQTYDHNPIELVVGSLIGEELDPQGKPRAPAVAYLKRFEQASQAVPEGSTNPADDAWSRRAERLSALRDFGFFQEAFYLAESLANPFEAMATKDFLETLKGTKREKDIPYWPQAVWLKSLAPTTGGRPQEFAGIADRMLPYLDQARAQALGQMRLPTREEKQAIHEAWKSLLQVAYGTRSRLSRKDLQRLTTEYAAGAFESAVLSESPIWVSRVDRDGTVFFDLDYLTGELTRVKGGRLELGEEDKFRLRLPSYDGEDRMELRPVDWSN